MSCQLINLSEIKSKNSLFNDVLQQRIKLIWKIKESIVHIFSLLRRPFSMNRREQHISGLIEIDEIKSGDLIKVRSKPEIQERLDNWGRTGRCSFVTEMYDSCDNIYSVLKTVDYFYDETKKKMCRCKNIVLLEGSLCGGKRRMFSSPCDRSCFYFWHTAWLQKVQGNELHRCKQRDIEMSFPTTK